MTDNSVVFEFEHFFVRKRQNFNFVNCKSFFSVTCDLCLGNRVIFFVRHWQRLNFVEINDLFLRQTFYFLEIECLLCETVTEFFSNIRIIFTRIRALILKERDRTLILWVQRNFFCDMKICVWGIR